MRTAIAAPRASALIESMRDIGYSLSTALADIIDNSITAKARNIHILTEDTETQRYIAIVDDGNGMDESELLEAMRPGAFGPLGARSKSDLGRFGLGLKTASFSQCRKLSVVSRKNGVTSAAIWDLDHVQLRDEWELLIPDSAEDIPEFANLTDHGTVVVWENLDRMDGVTSTSKSTSAMNQKLAEASTHLELVFHRFMSSEPGHRRISIKVNNRSLEPFDPFASGHPATIMGPQEDLRAGSAVIRIQSFTLPHHRKTSSREWERLGGPEGYLRNQGFYVYRQRRLIVHGTWFGLARQQELTKLSRVRVDVPNSLDAEWKLDIRKASAVPPAAVRNRLRRVVDEMGQSSKRVYRSRGARLVSENPVPVWDRVQDKGQIVYRVNREHPLIRAATDSQSPVKSGDASTLVELLESTIPFDAIYSDFGEGNENLAHVSVSNELLAATLIHTVAELKRLGLPTNQFQRVLRMGEPFSSNWKATADLFDELDLEQI